MTLRAIILGCGTSSGVPRIGNDWGQCDPAEPRNRRTRVSIIIESPTTRILVDTSPDMRAQLLAAGIADIDAILWTHDHATIVMASMTCGNSCTVPERQFPATPGHRP